MRGPHGEQVKGVGLGLRRQFLPDLRRPTLAEGVDFLEVAPENWIHVGGQLGAALRAVTERYPVVCHGLSLSLGGPSALDERLLVRVKAFMALHGSGLYTEHLSYSAADGHLYELLPLAFTEESVMHTARRIRQAQDLLGQRIAIENASYYARMPLSEMSELEFTRAVLEESDCLMHLDVNNVYVNCVNHGGDPTAFISALPSNRIAYLHVAGHDKVHDTLLVDTHGSPVISPVWELLSHTYKAHGLFPTTLERDLKIPPLNDLKPELAKIAELQGKDHGACQASTHPQAAGL